jgi:hypothetical protein
MLALGCLFTRLFSLQYCQLKRLLSPVREFRNGCG